MNFDINSTKAMTELYHEYRDEFLRHTAQYPLSHTEKIDIYQDAFIVVYEGLKYGHIKIEKTIKHYLYGVGRNMIIDKIASQIRERKLIAEMTKDKVKVDTGYYQLPSLSEPEERLHRAIEALSAKCKEILVLFYFRKYSIDAIMRAMNYNNENVTKSHKSRCLKNLKMILQKET